ncbi:MAG TPA: hypothetical protein PKD64_00330 [Pirellulaceae bacterium]|nr:hypothetical protein [Pirellulaceae bacterium]HMO90616.1 hypothetical protein [Pirellulaceae bacterium]HMP67805.1 hypothetical protein [Pirellulaceae bacterium]
MNTDPSQPSDFGSSQFRKIQFGHKPHEEIKSEDIERSARERISVPAKILLILSILHIAGLAIFAMVYVGGMTVNKGEWVEYWNELAREQHRANKRTSGAQNPRLNKKEEEELKKVYAWNENLFAIMLTAQIIQFFAGMCFAVFIAVAARNMMQLKRRRQAYIASILSVIPFTAPLFILGIPIGIWCLIALGHPDVKRAFDRIK